MDEVLSIVAPFYRLHQEDEDLFVFGDVRQISGNSDIKIEIPENDLKWFISTPEDGLEPA